uniref:Cholesteryl ester transfer protein, plasma n=1 Tax=Sparus aurata TaxID=8175 RepID=A0A671TYM7_SPAAU
ISPFLFITLVFLSRVQLVELPFKHLCPYVCVCVLLAVNEKTTKVIEAAFQHARYPSMGGEKSLLFIGRVIYGLDNLEVHNLSIGRSEFELHPGEGIGMEITNVSAVFKGTIQYGYGSWLVNVKHSIDFEIESQIDLGINPKLYCGDGKVAADTSDCYLNFHKLRLHLQGDKEPNWLKRLFTDFITFTVKMAIKGQICKEINKLANILADFIQETAEHFLTDGDISVNIAITGPPVITANYIESYHKGLTNYNNTSAVINDSVFHPSQLNENKMLYFWLSVLEVELTRLLDKQGVNLFDIFNPEVLPRDGFVVISMDFGFPHHLLVEFLKKTLQ